MEKMAKVSHAEFVLHIREPGENDRLMQNVRCFLVGSKQKSEYILVLM